MAARGVGATSAFADGAGQGRNTAAAVSTEASGSKDVSGTITVSDYAGSNCQHVDADNDGICDNCESRCQYVDVNGDVNYDNTGNNCQHIDADNDGICDNCNADCGGANYGTAYSDGNNTYGHHNGHGNGHSYSHHNHGGCGR